MIAIRQLWESDMTGLSETDTVSSRLAAARQQSGHSIRSLQKALEAIEGVKGSGYASVHAYVTGKTVPRRDWLMAAADVLEVRLEWLAHGEGVMTLADEAIARRTMIEEETARLSQEPFFHGLLGNLLAPYPLPLEVRQAMYAYLWRRFGLTGRAAQLEAVRDQVELETTRAALLKHLEYEIDTFVSQKLGPALQARGLRPSEYASALFSQLSVLYLTDPPEGPHDAD